jgi:hypothetical protein
MDNLKDKSAIVPFEVKKHHWLLIALLKLKPKPLTKRQKSYREGFKDCLWLIVVLVGIPLLGIQIYWSGAKFACESIQKNNPTIDVKCTIKVPIELR